MYPFFRPRISLKPRWPSSRSFIFFNFLFFFSVSHFYFWVLFVGFSGKRSNLCQFLFKYIFVVFVISLLVDQHIFGRVIVISEFLLVQTCMRMRSFFYVSVTDMHIVIL